MSVKVKPEGRRTVRLFRNGRSQAVRIPREFELEGDEVLIARDAEGRLTLEPIPKPRSLLDVLATLSPLPIGDRLSVMEDFPPEPVDLDRFDAARKG